MTEGAENSPSLSRVLLGAFLELLSCLIFSTSNSLIQGFEVAPSDLIVLRSIIALGFCTTWVAFVRKQPWFSDKTTCKQKASRVSNREKKSNPVRFLPLLLGHGGFLRRAHVRDEPALGLLREASPPGNLRHLCPINRHFHPNHRSICQASPALSVDGNVHRPPRPRRRVGREADNLSLRKSRERVKAVFKFFKFSNDREDDGMRIWSIWTILRSSSASLWPS